MEARKHSTAAVDGRICHEPEQPQRVLWLREPLREQVKDSKGGEAGKKTNNWSRRQAAQAPINLASWHTTVTTLPFLSFLILHHKLFYEHPRQCQDKIPHDEERKFVFEISL